MWGLSFILFWPSNRLATRLLTLTPSKHRSCTVSISMFVLLLLFTLYCCCKGARETSWTRSIKLFVLLTSVKLQSLKSQRAILNTHIHTSTVICENISAETRRRGMQRQEEQGCLLCCAVCFWGFFFCLFSFIQGQKEEPLKWEWVGKKEEADQQTETVKDTDSQRGWKTDAEKEHIPCSLSSHVHEENTSRQL